MHPAIKIMCPSVLHVCFFIISSFPYGMGTNGQLFSLTDNTDGTAVDQVQQQHLFISKLHRLTLGSYLFTSNYQY